VERDCADTVKFKANSTLFNMNGTDPILREKYLKKMHERVLTDLSGDVGTAESSEDNKTAGYDAISSWRWMEQHAVSRAKNKNWSA
jgi:hypothetical protein